MREKLARRMDVTHMMGLCLQHIGPEVIAKVAHTLVCKRLRRVLLLGEFLPCTYTLIHRYYSGPMGQGSNTPGNLVYGRF